MPLAEKTKKFKSAENSGQNIYLTGQEPLAESFISPKQDHHTLIKEKNIENWDRWIWQSRNRITSLEELGKWINLTQQEKKAIKYSAGRLKMAITPHFVSLMDRDNHDCPIRKQAIPSLAEFRLGSSELADPCGEERDTVAPGLVHRYPDRVLFLMTDACAMYCRHCTRSCLLYTSPSPRDRTRSRMPSSA